ncbi:carbamate kinase-like protein [Hesseltinella vesiculosa]|uniref:Isopentenyl phosphate kinase n=1 Tax=Hesseltinella vesiculosa TaxID=101127 RepID=A0A1X2GDV5_9FUNG|nr:carbamate kinase-like protein [Hesseltinella vesiculosa]
MTTVIVKLGGAAITDKSTPDTYSQSLGVVIQRVADAYLHRLVPENKQMILVHGAGSFGHPPAKKFNVKQGWSHIQDKHDQDLVKQGMSLTRERMLALHHGIMEHCRLQGLPVLSVSPYDIVETNSGALTPEAGLHLQNRVTRLCQQGFVPVLFGDAVLDHTLGCTILSGDVLLHALATHLPSVQRCVFLTDVPGLYTSDPKTNPQASLIRHWRCAEQKAPLTNLSNTLSVDDVTGAMQGKIKWAKNIVLDAPQPVQVVICSALSLEIPAILSSSNPQEVAMKCTFITK